MPHHQGLTLTINETANGLPVSYYYKPNFMRAFLITLAISALGFFAEGTTTHEAQMTSYTVAEVLF